MPRPSGPPDVSQILYGMFFMLGSAYALQRQQHIRTDFLYGKWSVRTRGMVDAACYIGLYFPALAFFLWVGSEFAYRSILFNERIVTSPWMPIIWPLKLAIPISTMLLSDSGRVRTPQMPFRGDKGRESL